MMLAADVTIVAVDDDDGHLELLRRTLRRGGVSNPLVPIRSGQEALEFVERIGRYASRPPPERLLVLLDIHMPGGLDGIDVLRRIKADLRLHHIPVIMLTTTDDPREVRRCYALGCSAYLTKPIDAAGFIEAVSKLDSLTTALSSSSDSELAR